MLGFLDIIIVAVLVLIYGTIGFRRGSLRSVAAIGVLYASYMAAKFGSPVAFPIIVGVIPFFGAYMYIAIFAAIMYLTYLLLNIIVRGVVKSILSHMRPTMMSRIVGGIVGGILGVFMASILFYLAQIFLPMGTPLVSSILGSPVASALIDVVGKVL